MKKLFFIIATVFLIAPTAWADTETINPDGNPMPNGWVLYQLITFRSVSTDTATGSLTITKPSGTVENDVMFAGVAYDLLSGTPAITTPSGWTLIRTHENTGNIGMKTYYKVAGSSEPSDYTWTVTSGTGQVGGIATYQYANTSNPNNGSAGYDALATTLHLTPVVNATATDMQVLRMAAGSNLSGSSYSPTAGYTERWDRIEANDLVTFAMMDIAEKDSGSTGGATLTWSGGLVEYVSQTFVMAPAEEKHDVWADSDDLTLVNFSSGGSEMVSMADHSTTTLPIDSIVIHIRGRRDFGEGDAEIQAAVFNGANTCASSGNVQLSSIGVTEEIFPGFASPPTSVGGCSGSWTLASIDSLDIQLNAVSFANNPRVTKMWVVIHSSEAADVSGRRRKILMGNNNVKNIEYTRIEK